MPFTVNDLLSGGPLLEDKAANKMKTKGDSRWQQRHYTVELVLLTEYWAGFVSLIQAA